MLNLKMAEGIPCDSAQRLQHSQEIQRQPYFWWKKI